MRLLLIEDDPMVGKAMRQGLRGAGYTVDWVSDGHAATLALANGVYAAAVLDLGLPRRSGLDVLAALRARGDAIPVLIVSARDTVADRVKGLDTGADDYLLKPFELDELLARVRALLRRHAGSAAPQIRVGTLVLDPVRRSVTRDAVPVELSAREFALLHTLMQRPGALLTRAELEDSVYGWGDEVASNAVEVHLHHLRRKLGAGVIQNVRGLGYRIGAA
jgi:two-component system response regulator QseB